MLDRSFRVAELSDQPDALEAIRKLEKQLTEQQGSTVAIVAYATDEGHEDEQQR